MIAAGNHSAIQFLMKKEGIHEGTPNAGEEGAGERDFKVAVKGEGALKGSAGPTGKPFV